MLPIDKLEGIALVSYGVLFLNEQSEFGRNVLDMLRQPMEERKVQIARIYGNIEYPADFMLVGTMNIAATELIQWKAAEMRGNKPFHGFCGFI